MAGVRCCEGLPDGDSVNVNALGGPAIHMRLLSRAKYVPDDMAKAKNEKEENPLQTAPRVGVLEIVEELLDACSSVAYMLNRQGSNPHGDQVRRKEETPRSQYLEEKYPEHPLLPCDIQKRAINFQAANIVSSSIQPFQNYTALNYIEEKVNANKKFVWVQYHIGKGFAALEKLLKGYAGRHATGDQVFLADLFLAPQIYAAMTRFRVHMVLF
ncbi:hypothetical protein AAC387_Pa07g0434 [Persea americana]